MGGVVRRADCTTCSFPPRAQNIALHTTPCSPRRLRCGGKSSAWPPAQGIAGWRHNSSGLPVRRRRRADQAVEAVPPLARARSRFTASCIGPKGSGHARDARMFSMGSKAWQSTSPNASTLQWSPSRRCRASSHSRGFVHRDGQVAPTAEELGNAADDAQRRN
jgi:hypothetical protein